MKLIETTILETTIRMRYADNADPAKATQWLDFQVPLSALIDPRTEDHKLSDIQKRFLATIQQAALRHVRGLISDENTRLAPLSGP
jgi:hypothetical protein